MFIHENVGQSDFHERFDWFAFKMPMKTEQRGFTLIEVLIAITILAFVILSMFAIYVHVIRELRRAKNRTYAMQAIASHVAGRSDTVLAMVTRRQGAVETALLGSVTAGCLRQAGVPVLMRAP